jgi:hypothetical protein
MVSKSKSAEQNGKQVGFELVKTMVPLDSIFEDMANANVHDEADVTSIMAKLAYFGQVEPLVVQASTRKIIGGNGRLHAMRRLGWTECWASFEEVDNVTATAMGIALNTRKSHFDEPILAKHLRALQSEGFNLTPTGFEDADVDQMLARLGAGLLGNEPMPDDGQTGSPAEARATLAERFGVPPFSVLDARQGYWQERKRAWLALGIQSELGRGGCRREADDERYDSAAQAIGGSGVEARERERERERVMQSPGDR